VRAGKNFSDFGQRLASGCAKSGPWLSAPVP
jgi:hypothetical protein